MPATKSIPATVKIPQQKRSREKFNAMLTAAERLFTEQGVRKTSVSEIVESAGVSIGAFYQRFENKEAIIHTIFYLLEDEIGEMTEALKLSDVRSLDKTVELIVSSIIQLYTEKRGVYLALLLEVQENPNIRRYVADLRNKMAEFYTEALSAYKQEIGARRFKTATAMSLRILNSYADQYLIWGGQEAEDSVLKYEASHRELVKVILCMTKIIYRYI